MQLVVNTTPRLAELVLKVCFYLDRKWTALYFCDI